MRAQLLPLFGTGLRSIAPSLSAQRRLNCFFDVRVDQDKTSLAVLGTPGRSLWVTIPSYPIYGLHTVDTVLYVVAGSTLYSVNLAGTVTALGSLPTVTGPVSMTDDSFNLVIADGVQGHLYNLSTGVLSAITDVNYPGGSASITFANSKILAVSPNSRQVYMSRNYDAGNWTPGTFFTKEEYSDQLLAIDNLNGTLILWGASSIEYWQDAGLSNYNPFQKIVGATQRWGLAALYSRAVADNTMVFLATNPQGSVQVCRLNGNTPIPISTADIDYVINQDIRTFRNAVALTYTVMGHTMYQITFPTGNRSFLYDMKTGIWSDVQTGLATTGRSDMERSVAYNGRSYVSDSSTGGLFELSMDEFTEDGQYIKRQVDSRHVYMNGMEFGISDLLLDMETGTWPVTYTGEPKVSLQVSKDRGHTYGVEHMAAMGRVGEYSKRVSFNRLGSAKQFQFRITVTDPVQFCITRADASVESSEDEE